MFLDDSRIHINDIELTRHTDAVNCSNGIVSVALDNLSGFQSSGYQPEHSTDSRVVRVMNVFLNLLFPQKCPFCGKPMMELGICSNCWTKLPWIKQGIRRGPDGFQCAGALRYEGLAREGLLRLKFYGGISAAGPLGSLIADCISDSSAFDIVTWVPLSSRRKRRRGYNQAELLAFSACHIWKRSPIRLLIKHIDNPAQSGIHDVNMRLKNVTGVYQIAPYVAVQGKKILLIDDICTTGATLDACRQVLLQNGASEVICAAVALARPDNPEVI